MEETVKALGFDIEKQDYKMNLRGSECGQKPCLSIATEENCGSMFVEHQHRYRQ
ncbi:hypothetical protein KP509_20G006300 [Ceratopteris richardii]|uniref:Uncharacterized protein n=1 Tax=Ceratopteris richardii TaxID=49495 RepID=A0A8T2SCQ2_CERRI|nr:hypothetical protein KP509_20G006300 [Ceratopteris richardii]